MGAENGGVAVKSSKKKKSSNGVNGQQKQDKRKGKMTSFVLFIKEKRELYKSQNPSIKTTEISTLAGKDWAMLSDNEKNKYKQMAEKYNSGIV